MISQALANHGEASTIAGASAQPPYSEMLADFAINQKSFPPEVLNEGKRIIVDQLACQIACAELPWSKSYRKAVKSLGSGTGATVVYYGDKLSLDEATFLNSAFGHGNEFDDTHLRSTTHPGAVVLPGVLAVAENRRLPGAKVLDAVVAGSEIMIRLATAASPFLHDRGHHTPPAVGPFGAAAACARVMDTDANTCLNAMAIAGSHAGGLLEYDRTGGSVKRIHCAIPAMAGVRSAVIAAHGITGPRTVIEGERGFLKVFCGNYNAPLLTKDLGKDYLILGMAYKPFACNFSTHAPFEALGWLIKEHKLEASQVATIEIGTSHHTIAHAGTIRAPKDILGAQFSLAFGCAVRLFRGGNGFYDYREEDLTDPNFLDVAHRVELKVDPVCDQERKTLNNRSAVVTVKTTDGRSLEKRVQYSKGLPENPLSDDELTAKFMDTVTPRLGKSRSAQIVEQIWQIEKMPNAGELITLTIGETNG
jgi:2-methylcitrate dehydratase PrpD